MVDSILRIKYPMGVMVIYTDQFFPANHRDVKRLLRIVDMSYNPDQLRDQMCRYLRERIESIEQELPRMAEEYVRLRTQYMEITNWLETRRAANGQPLTKDQHKAVQMAMRSLRGRVHDANMRIQRIKRAKRLIPALRKNLEVIEDA